MSLARVFNPEDIALLNELSKRGRVSNERIGAMVAYLWQRGIRLDGPFMAFGYVIDGSNDLSATVRQFEHAQRLSKTDEQDKRLPFQRGMTPCYQHID